MASATEVLFVSSLSMAMSTERNFSELLFMMFTGISCSFMAAAIGGSASQYFFFGKGLLVIGRKVRRRLALRLLTSSDHAVLHHGL